LTTAALHRGRVLADLIPGAMVRDIALIVGGAGLTGLAAQVSIHTSLTPVPFTLQTLSVLLVGAALGSLRGLLSIALYMVAGMAGVPWFSQHTSGFHFPSFGYIVGFVLAAGLVGFLAERGQDRSITSTIGMMMLGNVVLYVIGAAWLKVDLNLSTEKAIALGITPFLVLDAVKIAIAALVLPAAWKLARR
jgi:biotin transport system substrate-specific component